MPQPTTPEEAIVLIFVAVILSLIGLAIAIASHLRNKHEGDPKDDKWIERYGKSKRNTDRI